MTQKVQVNFVLPEQLPAGTTFNKGQYRFTSIAQLIANVADNMLYRGRYESRLDDGSYEVEPGGPGACDPKDIDWDSLPKIPENASKAKDEWELAWEKEFPGLGEKHDRYVLSTEREWERAGFKYGYLAAKAKYETKTDA